LHIAREKQPIETLLVIFLAEQPAKLRHDGGFSRNIARRFHPGAAEALLGAGFTLQIRRSLSTRPWRSTRCIIRSAPHHIQEIA
jgi:hypothetical protein